MTKSNSTQENGQISLIWLLDMPTPWGCEKMEPLLLLDRMQTDNVLSTGGATLLPSVQVKTGPSVCVKTGAYY